MIITNEVRHTMKIDTEDSQLNGLRVSLIGFLISVLGFLLFVGEFLALGRGLIYTGIAVVFVGVVLHVMLMLKRMKRADNGKT